MKDLFNLRKTEMARRPDLVLKHVDGKKILIIDMACPNEKNIDETNNGKLRKCQQLAFEFGERRPGFRIEIVPIVIGCMGGGMKKVKGQIWKALTDGKTVTAVAQEIMRTVLCEIETMLRKATSGLIQGE